MNATLIGCPAVPALLDAYLHRRLPHPQHVMLRDHLDTCQPCWEIWNRHRWDAAAGHPLVAALRDFLGSSYRPYLDSSRTLLRGGLHRVPGIRGRERAWLFRGSGLKKSPAFGAFVCWRWRAGAGDDVA